jgi:hypothetical protein
MHAWEKPSITTLYRLFAANLLFEHATCSRFAGVNASQMQQNRLGGSMLIRFFRNCAIAVVLTIGLLGARMATAGVVVTILDSNTATATISLTDTSSHTYAADIKITFDNAINLSTDSLNLTAQLIDPSNPPAVLPANVSVDPAFPVLISVEPPVALFMNSHEANQVGDGNLAFYNTYYFDMHTTNLACSSSTSPYRLYKAPHGSTAFADVSDEILSGSVRARGRGGAFSQFLIVVDNRPQFLLLVPVIAVEKLTNLSLRLVAATLNATLRGNLNTLLVNISTALAVLDYATAIANLDAFISQVTAAAGVGDIPNEWIAGGSLSNDAGELISLAQTLRFTLVLLQGNALCLPPGP